MRPAHSSPALPLAAGTAPASTSPAGSGAVRKLWIFVALAAAVIVILTAITWISDRPEIAKPEYPPIASLKPGYGPGNFAAAMKSANDHLALGLQDIERGPNEWAYQEEYARALLARYRLSGSFDDLAEAGETLDSAMRNAPRGSGPLLTDAVYNLTVHRNAQVNPILDMFVATAVPPDISDRAETIAMRGDVAFYAGRYAAALQKYREAAKLADGPGIAYRIAQYYKKTGHPDAALREFARAGSMEAHPSPKFLSSLLLQSGTIELERGHWDEAEAYFRKADQAFPGYWLGQAHLAQMIALKGDYAKAARYYEDIIARSGSPEVMDALAALTRMQGDGETSRAWSAKAGEIWQKRVAQLPEAAYAHAVDHELVFGERTRALELAQANYRNRRYGDSAVLLGWALIANNRPRAAAALLEKTGASGWDVAQQHSALAEAYDMLGMAEKSQAERAKAIALNPHIFDAVVPLIWFGHH